jgi:2'-5' RNA ligase
MTAAPPASLRLFLALWPTAGMVETLQAHALAWSWTAQARATRPERLHVTLHFLGAVADARLPALRATLPVPWSGCTLVLDRAQVWAGGMAVVEAGTVPPELAALHGALAARLAVLGLPVEARRWRPHVTLARKAFGARPPASFAPLRWEAGGSYALVRTLPGGRGYETLASFG